MATKSERFPERIFVTRETAQVGDGEFLVVHEDIDTIENADAESVALYQRIGVGRVRIQRDFEPGGGS